MAAAASPVEAERVRDLNTKPILKDRQYVAYWMQAAQRAIHNYALEHAVFLANEHQLPLLVVFGLTDKYPSANERSYAFMLEGLADAQRTLLDRGIDMVLRKQPPGDAALAVASEAALVVTDMGYLNIQRSWREAVAGRAPCRLIQVESEVVVPVECASGKEEWAGRTMRPKINAALQSFLVDLPPVDVHFPSAGLGLGPRDCVLDLTDMEAVLADMDIDRSVPRVSSVLGGTTCAVAQLQRFIDTKLSLYDKHRNDAGLECATSRLSAYLHFGQISPVHIVRELRKHKKSSRSFVEELVVRRELAMNFCHYNHEYDQLYKAIPEWCRITLDLHKDDPREFLYTREQFEKAQTHDLYWNAAQLEMVHTGYMHNYMRMYWGKKILEWTPSPGEAHSVALYLNDKYQLDGRDANGYTGIAWIFGKHDTAWTERPVFGKTRYMNAQGLKRKMGIHSYVDRITGIHGASIEGKEPEKRAKTKKTAGKGQKRKMDDFLKPTAKRKK